MTVSGNRNHERGPIRDPRSGERQLRVRSAGILCRAFGLAPSQNTFTAPACCETLAQYHADFAQAILSPHSVQISTPGNNVGDSGSLLVNASTASGYPRLGAGSFAAAYGSGLAGPQPAIAAPPFPTTLGGVTVTVRDSAGVTWAAPIQAVYASQVNYIVPPAPGIATVTIGKFEGSAQIDAVGPGLYSMNGDGKGVAAATAAIYSADGTITPETVFTCSASSGCVAVPISLGGAGDQLAVTLYGTGLRNLSATQNAAVTVGGLRPTIQYIGAQPQYPGLDQVNLLIPRSLAGVGEVPVLLTVDGQTANVVTLSFR